MGLLKKIAIGVLVFILSLVCIYSTFEGRYQMYLGGAKLAPYMPQKLADVFQKITLVATIVACKGDYGICGRAEFGRMFHRQAGGDAGYAIGLGPFPWVVNTHERYLEWIYSTELERDPNIFIGAKLDQITPGIIPSNTLLNLGTGDPEHNRRRQLISDAITALARHPERPKLITPGWAVKTGGADVIMKLTGLNIFKWMFDIDLEEQHLDMLMEFNRISGPIALGLSSGSAEDAEVVGNIVKTLTDLIRKSETGTNFAALSDERGYDTETRLNELTAILMFAGFGGTSAYATATIDRIRGDPAHYVPLYLNNRTNFLKESARLNPPVGGLIVRAYKDVDATLGGDLTGKHLIINKGTNGALWIPSANKDLKIFGGAEMSQEYAFKFDPTRENLDKIMTWNGLLDDIERGYAPTPGTKGHSPRACPGAVFAIQIVEKVVDYFLPGPDGKHTEL